MSTSRSKQSQCEETSGEEVEDVADEEQVDDEVGEHDERAEVADAIYSYVLTGRSAHRFHVHYSLIRKVFRQI